ncbi:hypothetical protein [Arthrobacter burdickii]|uniref:Uncharacterized protein n=1 Tax=Arthrobacter burdickii TaxID=3035920 RepID=A0ABT8K568_9MICC|nr:hypothetical protein [Arthrobacter burdickii]MDN4611941.1 hypothetical protein [Arthrobacter burdickii]
MALTYAAPDSPAASYARVAQNEWLAWQIVEELPEPGTLEDVGSGFRFCSTATTDRCLEVDNFRFDQNNQLQDFTINDIPVSSVTMLPRETDYGGANIDLIFNGGMLFTSSDQIEFAVQIYNRGPDIELDMTRATYKDANGEFRDVMQYTGNETITTNQRMNLFVRTRGPAGGSFGVPSGTGAGEAWHWVPIR